jgi:hypothetical protein
MDSVGHFVRFPMLTHTHVFDSYNNGYGHLSTTMCRVQRVAVNWNLQRL